MAGKPAGEKTEKATPRKIKKAKSEGQIGHSNELGSWASILAASFVLPKVTGSLMATSRTTMVEIGALIGDPDIGRALAIFRTAIFEGAKSVGPLVIVILVTSISAASLQGGLHFAPKSFMPKASRLNPTHGLKRMFGPQGLWEMLKSLAKVAVLTGVTYLAVRNLVPTLMAAGSLPLTTILDEVIAESLKLIRMGAVAGLVLASADVIVVRRRNNKQLKMTKQEVKEENKSSEGDPQMHAAIRAKALAISRNRMMADVPDADVVVVNPTHVAVALKYDPTKGAPRVVAKGADNIAAKIRELAEENRIPMVQDIALARTLFATCDIGQEIPAELYQGVAAVLAFVMRLKRRGSAAGMHTLTRV